MIGYPLGHYRIEAKLGEGGMGMVNKARDTHLDRPGPLRLPLICWAQMSKPEETLCTGLNLRKRLAEWKLMCGQLLSELN
jgi:serine/threonine protein kinase